MIRKDYEAHRIQARRKDIKTLVPMGDNISRTITTFIEDNLLLEVYEKEITAIY